jgi:hypothetical protein
METITSGLPLEATRFQNIEDLSEYKLRFTFQSNSLRHNFLGTIRI